MKKILITILIILLIIMVYFALFKGIGVLGIISVQDITALDQTLSTQIDETNKLITATYPEKINELKNVTNDLLTAKSEYLELAKISTDKQIQIANQEQSYKVEFLWTKIGNHAIAEGVNIEFNIIDGDTTDFKNLGFTVKGSYIAITNFIYAIENDSELNFRIQNFKLIPGASDIDLSAVFTVKNIRVKTENITQTVTNNNESRTTTTDIQSQTINTNATTNEQVNTEEETDIINAIMQ